MKVIVKSTTITWWVIIIRLVIKYACKMERTRNAFPEGKNVLQNKRDALIGCCIGSRMGQIVWHQKYANFGDPEMTCGYIWSKNFFFSNFVIVDPPNGHLWHPNYANFGHGRPPNDFWGHLKQKHFSVNVCIFSPKQGIFDPHNGHF